MIGRPRDSKPSNALYEQVLTKNFQIIQTFLSQFHEIFSKQDQFQATLNKFQHRITSMQKNNKKLDQILTRSSDMYEKKMNSLKQYILQKLKPQSSPSPQPEQSASQTQTPSALPSSPSACSGLPCPKNENKKQDQSVIFNEHIKKLQWQIVLINQKINSLTSITNNIDERIRITFNQSYYGDRGLSFNPNGANGNGEKSRQKGDKDRDREGDKEKNQKDKLEKIVKVQIEELERKIQGNVGFFRGENMRLYKKIGQIETIEIKINQLIETTKQKLNISDFQDFKQLYKSDQQCLIRQISQQFPKKLQTKKSLHTLQKKLQRFQIIQQMLKQNFEAHNSNFYSSNCNNLSVLSMGNGNGKSRPTSIHYKNRVRIGRDDREGKQTKATDGKEGVDGKQAIFVRRLQARKSNDLL